MHISSALKSVRSHIRGALENHHHSPTIVQIFAKEVNSCIDALKEQFEVASRQGGQRILWPKMVVDYKPDDEEKLSPVQSPIKDSRGFILGVKVVCKERSDGLRSTRAYLEWFPPDL